MLPPGVIKIGVLADGQLRLDGQPAGLPALGLALDAAAPGAVVWYYRENAAAPPHPLALEVMKLITSHRLPIRLSTLPDYSDSVAPAAPNPESLFAAVREKAAQRNLVILRPDGRPLLLPAVKPEAMPPGAVASVEKLLPSKAARNVAVIGDTSWTMTEAPSLQSANAAIPFFGLLMGFASIGHAVWVFDAGIAQPITAGSRDADVLIVDSARLPALPPGWQAAAAKGMRTRQILVHDRATFRLRVPDPENG